MDGCREMSLINHGLVYKESWCSFVLGEWDFGCILINFIIASN
jgi:hypothetical protein